MPTATYEKLLAETCPQVIENDEQYDAIGRRFGELLVYWPALVDEARALRARGIRPAAPVTR